MSPDFKLLEMTTTIVVAYVLNHKIKPTELSELIADVAGAIATTRDGGTADKPKDLVPPVPISKTITPDVLISLEDGKPYRTLTRHLRSRGMTPADYRAKWGLPANYPMVSPDYSAARSAATKKTWLGRKLSAPLVEPTPPPKRHRPRKVIGPS